MSENNEKILETRSVDQVTLAIKSIVGPIPIVGPLLVELVGTLVPNQRIDRIADFAKKLQSRMNDLEDDTLRLKLADENFVDLLEESLQQVARSTSNERREYISNLIANGIKDDEMEFIEKKHLLKILGEINDIEVIWLMAYAEGFHSGGRSDFKKRHQNILQPITLTNRSSRADSDKKALQDSYKLHLERLGLLRINNRGSYEIAHLGRILVHHIIMDNSE